MEQNSPKVYCILDEVSKMPSEFLTFDEVLNKNITDYTQIWIRGSEPRIWKNAIDFPEFKHYFKNVPPPINSIKQEPNMPFENNESDEEDDIEYSELLEKMLSPGEKVISCAGVTPS